MSQLNASPATGAELYLFPNCVSAAGALQLRKGLQDLLFDLSAVGQSCACLGTTRVPSPPHSLLTTLGVQELSWELGTAQGMDRIPASCRTPGTGDRGCSGAETSQRALTEELWILLLRTAPWMLCPC